MRGYVAGFDRVARQCRGWRLAAALVLVVCAPLAAESKPQRVVSLDYCADQYVLALADPDQIVALSRDAGSERSYLAAEARAYPRTGDGAEEILMLRPDLVLRQWGGGQGSAEALSRFGIPAVTLSDAEDAAAMRDNIRRIAMALGHPRRAEKIIAEMDRRLATVRDAWSGKPETARPMAAYVTPGGATSGSGTLVHTAMTAAGLRNLAAEAGHTGWQTIDLERLVLAAPEAVVVGFHDLAYNATDPWRLGRHAVLRAFISERPTVYIPSRVFACPTWFFVDAVEDMHTALVAPKLTTRSAGVAR